MLTFPQCTLKIKKIQALFIARKILVFWVEYFIRVLNLLTENNNTLREGATALWILFLGFTRFL